MSNAGLILHGGNGGDCLLPLPWCPWNAPVEICNFLIGCPLPRRKCHGALALSKTRHTGVTGTWDNKRNIYFYTGVSLEGILTDHSWVKISFYLLILLPIKDAMSDFWPQTLKNSFFLVNGISKSITRSNEKSLTFTFNGQEPFLIKHIRIGHVTYCRDPEKN